MIFTAVPATAGAVAVDVVAVDVVAVDVVAEAVGPMLGMLDIPGMPTEVPPLDVKSTVGSGALAGVEHAATPTATAANTSAVRV
ncbi:hypothetical protein ACTXG7_25290 [Mycolicibacterium sp. Dal123E01]|uniref:hypothetical protein n=1 Tax=Mycolicibacterium sp. Dal123E01 TaxID=3457578 RepID=UPI00403E718E